MKRLFVLTTLFVFVLLSSAPAQASGLGKWGKIIGATPAQARQIKKIIYASQRKLLMLKAQRQIAMLDLHQLLQQHKPDKKAVLQAIEKVGKVETDMKKVHIMKMVDIKALLSAKQAARMQAHSKAQSKRKKRRRAMFKQWLQSKGK